MEFLKQVPSIRFMALRRYWYVLSAAVVAASIALVLVRGLNLTVDFTGGLVFELGFSRPVDLERVRAALNAGGIEDFQVRTYGTASELEVRLPPAESGMAGTEGERVVSALRPLDPAVELKRTESVGPQVSQQLGEQAALAILMTLLLVLIYIALRFRWRFGVGSLVASLHDPIVAVGAIAVLGIPFDLNVVAAVLTILGYSVNDTVVIFDRIRERFKSMRKAEPAEVIDRAINEMLGRTIIVAGCALSSVIFLAVLGGETLRGFAVALAIGIVIGTYSSVYVAGAIALDLGASGRDFMPPEKRGDVDELP
ncbi:MAG TPA: protein translocase subunit SecF [Steroidobacteraceae bacterium]